MRAINTFLGIADLLYALVMLFEPMKINRMF